MFPQYKVNICQTGGNKVARWRALLAISVYRDDPERYFPVLLRSQGTCLACALDEALAYEIEPCFLVL